VPRCGSVVIAAPTCSCKVVFEDLAEETQRRYEQRGPTCLSEPPWPTNARATYDRLTSCETFLGLVVPRKTSGAARFEDLDGASDGFLLRCGHHRCCHVRSPQRYTRNDCTPCRPLELSKGFDTRRNRRAVSRFRRPKTIRTSTYRFSTWSLACCSSDGSVPDAHGSSGSLDLVCISSLTDHQLSCVLCAFSDPLVGSVRGKVALVTGLVQPD
jgi:hypothetical protein